MRSFLLAFIPLFVAVDAIGILPLVVGMLDRVEAAQRRRVLTQSVITAASVAAVFVLGGGPMLRLLGISASDFMIAGGALLFALSLRDLLAAGKQHVRVDQETVGAVPIGVPLITGPAVLTTCMLLVDQHGWLPTLLAVLLNVGIAGVVFGFAVPIGARLGTSGTKVLSKIASLLLASIAVMIMRKGVFDLVAQWRAGG
jgi:multiple antibiotic resistance protein